MIESIFTTRGEELFRIILVGLFAYTGLIFLLRISGKRTLSKWNSFDFVVTVAFGSTFATALLNKDISVTEAVVAFGVLIGLQFLVTWLSVRSGLFQKMVKSQPSIIFRRGHFIEAEMKKKRVTQSEIKAAIRAKGHSSLGNIDAVVLETDGSFSVIKEYEADPKNSTINNVEGFDQHIKTSGKAFRR